MLDGLYDIEKVFLSELIDFGTDMKKSLSNGRRPKNTTQPYAKALNFRMEATVEARPGPTCPWRNAILPLLKTGS